MGKKYLLSALLHEDYFVSKAFFGHETNRLTYSGGNSAQNDSNRTFSILPEMVLNTIVTPSSDVTLPTAPEYWDV